MARLLWHCDACHAGYNTEDKANQCAVKSHLGLADVTITSLSYVGRSANDFYGISYYERKFPAALNVTLKWLMDNGEPLFIKHRYQLDKSFHYREGRHP